MRRLGDLRRSRHARRARSRPSRSSFASVHTAPKVLAERGEARRSPKFPLRRRGRPLLCTDYEPSRLTQELDRRIERIATLRACRQYTHEVTDSMSRSLHVSVAAAKITVSTTLTRASSRTADLSLRLTCTPARLQKRPDPRLSLGIHPSAPARRPRPPRSVPRKDTRVAFPGCSTTRSAPSSSPRRATSAATLIRAEPGDAAN